MRVLDIGCGWGEALKFAAEHYGIRGVGVTVSREQADYARDLCAGLPIDIRLQDYRELDERFDRMIEEGAIEEVRELLDLGLDPGLPAMRAHGVRELAAYLSGAASREDAVTKAKTESRRYAKRQMTWLRRFMADWDWFPDADTAIEEVTATR